MFTSGSILLGFIALVQSLEGAVLTAAGDDTARLKFAVAAKCLGFAIFADGLDGRIARATNTTSDFGREMDSLADFITFGIAPAVLAFVWGVRSVQFLPGNLVLHSHLTRLGYSVAFFYLLCAAVRLARFNVQTNPIPKNPGRPDRKYFVGLPSPAAAGIVAALVYFVERPIAAPILSLSWLALVGFAGFLMVSTWRYPSFKQYSFSKPRTPLIILMLGVVAFLILEWSQPFLLALASTYMLSGIIIRVGGSIRRMRKIRPSPQYGEHQIG